jgi:hypothetical protein
LGTNTPTSRLDGSTPPDRWAGDRNAGVRRAPGATTIGRPPVRGVRGSRGSGFEGFGVRAVRGSRGSGLTRTRPFQPAVFASHGLRVAVRPGRASATHGSAGTNVAGFTSTSATCPGSTVVFPHPKGLAARWSAVSASRRPGDVANPVRGSLSSRVGAAPAAGQYRHAGALGLFASLRFVSPGESMSIATVDQGDYVGPRHVGRACSVARAPCRSQSRRHGVVGRAARGLATRGWGRRGVWRRWALLATASDWFHVKHAREKPTPPRKIRCLTVDVCDPGDAAQAAPGKS